MPVDIAIANHATSRRMRKASRYRYICTALRACASVAVTLLITAGPAQSAGDERQVTKLADGVFTIRHAHIPGADSGNTTVIVGKRLVLVVDSGYLPSVAREDIAQIRHWTDKPVGYLVNTHYHNDHNNGNRAYLDAFPALTIIAQEETRRDMDLIQPGNIERTPREYEAAVAAYRQGKDENGQPLSEEDKAQALKVIPILEKVAADFRTIVYQPPTLTFTDRISIDLGDREVQVMHLGRGNTPGDAIAYLPKEKILVAGDLLVEPLPYVGDGYPAEWVMTLHKLAALNATTIVPGHGAVMHDNAYVQLVIELMQSAEDQVRARIRQLGFPGAHSLDEIKGFVDLTAFRARFAGDDKDVQARFDGMTADLVKITFSEAAQR
jgi:cyclase